MRKSLVSLVALGLFLGAPAMAQTTTDEATTNQATTQQQTTAPSAEQFERMLGEYEARSEIRGHIVRAIMPDGSRVLVLVGPRNLEPEQSVGANDSNISSRFEEGGFRDVVILGEPRIFRADLDDQHYIFALTADEMLRFGTQTGAATDTDTQMDPQSGTQSGTTTGQADTETDTQLGQTDTETQLGQTETQLGQTETQLGQTETQPGQTDTQLGQTDTETGTETETQLGQTDTEMDTETGTDTETQLGQTDTETGQIGRALSEPDTDRIVSNLEAAGLQEADEFQGRLVKAMTATDRPMFFVITSKDMESGGQIDINEDEVSQKLESAGLQDVQFIDDAKIVRGNLEGDHVFVLAGDLFGQAGQQ